MEKKPNAIASDYMQELMGSKQRLESFLNKYSIEDLERLMAAAKPTIERKRKEFHEQLKKEQELQANKQKLQQLAAEMGIAIEVLEGEKPKKARKASGYDPEMYAFVDEETGETHYWGGRGHAPKQFKVLLDAGVKKERLLNPKVEGHIYKWRNKPKKKAA